MQRMWRCKRAKGHATFKISQSRLAEELCRSRRSVQLYLGQLEVAGFITTSRTQTGNVYYFNDLTRTEAPTSEAQDLRLPGAEIAPPMRNDCASEAQDLRLPGAEIAHCINMGLETSMQNQQQQANQAAAPRAAAAAAAGLFDGIEAKETVAKLKKLGLREAKAIQFVKDQPKKAAAVADHFPALCQEINRREGVRNPTGLLVNVLHHPADYGFERQPDGTWSPPACAQPRAKATPITARIGIEPPAPSPQELSTADFLWQMATEDEREAVRRIVRAGWKGPEGGMFDGKCRRLHRDQCERNQKAPT